MIFADSSYLIALWDPTDGNHEAAGAMELKLKELRWVRGLGDLMTCLPMACEVAEHLSLKRGVQEGGRAFSLVMNNCRVISPTERDVQLAFDRTFRLYAAIRNKKRRPEMTDSIGVAVMRRFKVLRIVSFDMGFELIPDIRRIKIVGEGDAATLSTERA
jgi:predicted nucleic acid-binding protein